MLHLNIKFDNTQWIKKETALNYVLVKIWVDVPNSPNITIE
jgi:hypothetical protein